MGYLIAAQAETAESHFRLSQKAIPDAEFGLYI